MAAQKTKVVVINEEIIENDEAPSECRSQDAYEHVRRVSGKKKFEISVGLVVGLGKFFPATRKDTFYNFCSILYFVNFFYKSVQKS